MTEKLCHCGKPLHYSAPEIRRGVETLIEQLGETITVTMLYEGRERRWKVPRHYIALHGIKAVELPGLGFEEIASVDAEASLEVGTRVEKFNSIEGEDTHRDGALATVVEVLGQHRASGVWVYRVEWDDLPGLPVTVAGCRIRKAGAPAP